MSYLHTSFLCFHFDANYPVELIIVFLCFKTFVLSLLALTVVSVNANVLYTGILLAQLQKTKHKQKYTEIPGNVFELVAGSNEVFLINTTYGTIVIRSSAVHVIVMLSVAYPTYSSAAQQAPQHI